MDPQLEGLLAWSLRLSRGALALVSSFETLLLAGVILVFVLFVLTARRYRSMALASKAAGEPMKGATVFFELCAAFFHAFLRVLRWVPLALVFIVFMLSFGALSSALEGVESLLQRQARIRNLTMAVENLSASRKVASISVQAYRDGVSSLEVRIYDGAAGRQELSRQTFSLPGRDIHIDSAVLNVDFALIESGKKQNIAIPWRLYSENLAQIDAVPLGTLGEDGVPYAFNRSDEEIIGMAADAYRSILLELFSLRSEDRLLRSDGIVRSLYGNALHRVMRPGETWDLYLEASGGLSLREHRPF